MPFRFEYPQYEEALKQFQTGLEDWRGSALQNMLERQAAQGTLRAGGITDYPALDIEKATGLRLSEFAGNLAQREAATKIAREDAETAYKRQIEMFNRQIEAQRQLMQEQMELQRRGQQEMFWQNLGQNVIGMGVGALTGGLISPLAAGLSGLIGGGVQMPETMQASLSSLGFPATGGGWEQGLWRYQMQQMGIDPFLFALYQQMLQNK